MKITYTGMHGRFASQASGEAGYQVRQASKMLEQRGEGSPRRSDQRAPSPQRGNHDAVLRSSTGRYRFGRGSVHGLGPSARKARDAGREAPRKVARKKSSVRAAEGRRIRASRAGSGGGRRRSVAANFPGQSSPAPQAHDGGRSGPPDGGWPRIPSTATPKGVRVGAGLPPGRPF